MNHSRFLVFLLSAAGAGACGLLQDETTNGGQRPLVTERTSPPSAAGRHRPDVRSFGDPLPGLTAAELARFEAGLAEFNEVEEVADGLGPVFNGSSCAGCHSAPAVGGASEVVEVRFGTTSSTGEFDPLTELGGSLRQRFGIGLVSTPTTTCDFAGETAPAEATVVSGRLTTPLFGLGLVDAVPDATFVALAERQANETPETAGQVAMVTDPVTGLPAVGKFGWKNQNPSLFVFSGDAYVNEMGITSPLFPHENCPQGDCSLLECDPVADPEDDGSAVQAFADFMSLLAPPPKGPARPAARAGQNTFERVGCADCHTPRLETGPSPIAALDHQELFPYSDFLLHDMGALADGIAQAAASPTQMRTAPLWGARARTRFLHDGRATSVAEAIALHEGQATAARDAFLALPQRQQQAVLDFIDTL